MQDKMLLIWRTGTLSDIIMTMTKTRVQFLVAVCLIILPLLGFPTTIDMILVSLSGLLIAVTTFLTVQDRRRTKKLGVSIDPIRKTTRRRTTAKTRRVTKKETQKKAKDIKDDEDAEDTDEDTDLKEDDTETSVRTTKKRSSPILTETGVLS